MSLRRSSQPGQREAAAGHESPASVVKLTLEKVFGVVLLGVPGPSRIPAHGSLIVLFLTVLLVPLGVEPGPGHSWST